MRVGGGIWCSSGEGEGGEGEVTRGWLGFWGRGCLLREGKGGKTGWGSEEGGERGRTW